MTMRRQEIGKAWLHPAAPLALVALIGPLIWIIGGIAALSSPQALEYGEPFIVSAAWSQAAEGGRLYAPVDDLPFRHNNYNPLVQTVLGPVLWLTGPSYAPGRALTMLAFIALLGLIVRALWSERSHPWAILVALGLPLGAGFVFPWTCLGRVDVVATAFSVAAATVFFRGSLSLRHRALVLVCAWLAFAAKQSVLAGIGAVILVDFAHRRFRAGLAMGALFTAGVILLVLCFEWTSQGQYLWHAVRYMAGHDRGPLWPEALPLSAFPEVFGAGLLAVLGLLPWICRWSQDKAFVIYALLSLALALALVRKSGSHVHYLLEPVIAMSLLIGRGLGRLEVGAMAAPKGRAIRVALALAAALLLFSHWTQAGRAHGLWIEATRRGRVPPAVREAIRKGEGRSLLLAQTATLAIEEGREAIFDIADFARLCQTGQFDPEARLLPLVRARAFPIIAVQEFAADHPQRGLFAVEAIPGLSETIAAHYEEIARGTVFPRGRAPARFYAPRP